MTSVPVTLKFLRPHYPSLKDTYEKTAESNKNRVSFFREYRLDVTYDSP